MSKHLNQTIYAAIAMLLIGLGSIVPWSEAQQKPNAVIIWCQDSSGNYGPCLAGNSLDYDSGGGTVNQGTVGIVFPASGGPVAAPGDATNGMLVNLGANNDVTVTGTVTSNIGTTNGLFLDATFTGRFPAAFASADNIAAQTATALHGLTYIWDGSTWDRWTGAVTQSGTWNITNISGTVSLPTGAATETTSASMLTALQTIDNIVSGAGVNISQYNGATAQIAANSLNTTGAGLPAAALVGQCDDTSPTALTENQFGHARINCTTHQQLVEVGTALPTGSNTIGGVNLTQYTPVSGRLPVDPSGVTAPVSMATNTPVGNVAHDGADSGAPLKTGAKATTSLSAKTMVANDDRTDTFAGIDGVPIVRLHSNLEDRVSNAVGVTDGSSTSLIAAQGAGIRFCAVTLVVSNSSATNVTVDIRDGTAGSVLMTIPAAANMGGGVIPLGVPLCTTANTAMAMDPSASATTVTVTAVGFKTKL